MQVERVVATRYDVDAGREEFLVKVGTLLSTVAVQHPCFVHLMSNTLKEMPSQEVHPAYN
jgi:hypothetical protein